MFNKIIIKNWINLISYFYYIAPDITKFEIFLGIYKRKIRIINIYNNKVRKSQR